MLLCPNCRKPKPSAYASPCEILECGRCSYSGSSDTWLDRRGLPVGEPCAIELSDYQLEIKVSA